MYIECGHCKNPNITMLTNDSSHAFYCKQCNRFLKLNEVKKYTSLASHYMNDRYCSILVVDMDKHKVF